MLKDRSLTVCYVYCSASLGYLLVFSFALGTFDFGLFLKKNLYLLFILEKYRISIYASFHLDSVQNRFTFHIWVQIGVQSNSNLIAIHWALTLKVLISDLYIFCSPPLPPHFWGTPKLHKEGKNVAHVCAKTPHFSTGCPRFFENRFKTFLRPI